MRYAILGGTGGHCSPSSSRRSKVGESSNLKEAQGKLKDGDKNDEKKDSKQKKNNKDTTRQSRRRMKLGRSFHPRLERLKQSKRGGKKWNWCEHHQAWCIHSPQDCKVGKKLMAEANRQVANQAQVKDESGSASRPNNLYAALLAHLASQDME
jgi:hypothetical protein